MHNFNSLEKHQLFVHDLLMLINASILKFLNDIDFLTEDLLCNINVKVIKNALFK